MLVVLYFALEIFADLFDVFHHQLPKFVALHARSSLTDHTGFKGHGFIAAFDEFSLRKSQMFGDDGKWWGLRLV